MSRPGIVLFLFGLAVGGVLAGLGGYFGAEKIFEMRERTMQAIRANAPHGIPFSHAPIDPDAAAKQELVTYFETAFDATAAASGTEMKLTVDCGLQGCFQNKFAACQPASMDVDTGAMAVHYQILTADQGGCEMTMVYTRHANSDWQGKPMTCIFDNKLELQASIDRVFADAVAGKSSCEGPLADALKMSRR
jgi:hypothetical protein